jgi:hypothetical protein
MDPNRKKKIEDQIESEQKAISYDMKEFTIELYVNKYLDRIDEDDNELYVPDYQREFIWDDKHQSRFIESLFLGLSCTIYVLCRNKRVWTFRNSR